MQSKRPLSLRRQGIYLLPNLFTLAALFFGFYAVIQSMNQHFDQAAVAIFTAMLLDGLDGRVARITHTQSKFGAEFDSLSDMVSFGLAPALVVYEWMLKDFGKIGWVVAFIYCACAALRLARFNTNIGAVDVRWFQGLSSTAAAGLLAGFVWICIENNQPLKHFYYLLPWISLFLTLFSGLTMVSNVKFWGFKEFHMQKKVPFLSLLTVVLAIVAIAATPAVVLFGFFFCYACSGYFYWVYLQVTKRKYG